MRIILASKSPRRRELLKYIIDDFDIISPDIEEKYPPEIDSFDIPQYLSNLKATHIHKTHPEDLIIGCDTAVFTKTGEMLGKPKDETDAYRMLKSLSGQTHTVITGCTLILKEKHISFSSKTDVTFTSLTDKEIWDYIATGDPMDKAGSYGIQQKGAFLTERINGDFYTVMGMPVCTLNKEIKKLLT